MIIHTGRFEIIVHNEFLARIQLDFRNRDDYSLTLETLETITLEALETPLGAKLELQ